MGSIYEKNGRLYMSFKTASGKWTTKSTKLPVGQEKRAKTMLDQTEQQIAMGLELGAVDGKATVTAYAKRWIAERKAQGIRSIGDEESRLRIHVLPEIGSLPMADVRPRHIRDLVRHLKQKNSARGELLAPRSVRHIYAVTRLMFKDAIVDELIDATPCVLKRHDLPKKIDKDPTFRAQATFTREELEALISDDRSPEERRMLYALMGLGGMRFGEAVARRWRDYEPKLKPLGKLLIASSFDVKTHKEKSVKTQAPREMPVHPTLAKMLAAWKLGGWERMMGRPPRAEDLIVPSDTGNHRNVNRGLHNFHYDLKRLGQRKRRQHDLRRTFITLARSGGARPDILKWATHGPSGDIIDIYTSMPWEPLCEAVSCLKLDLLEGKVIQLKVQNVSGADGGFLPSFSRSIPDKKNPEVSSTSGLRVGGADGTRTRGLRRDRPAL